MNLRLAHNRHTLALRNSLDLAVGLTDSQSAVPASLSDCLLRDPAVWMIHLKKMDRGTGSKILTPCAPRQPGAPERLALTANDLPTTSNWREL